jgi:centrosomal protein CEP41
MLILDVRMSSDFEACHLKHATCYPENLLRMDKISPDLYSFKSAGGSQRRLVVYDEDDRLTVRAATLLVEKGFENVYALSGGFEEAVLKCTEAVEGDVPEKYLAMASADGGSGAVSVQVSQSGVKLAS